MGGVVQFPTPVIVTPEEGGIAEVAVTRSGGAASGVTVQYATANGSAIAGLDYVAKSGTVTFDAGVNTMIIPVTLLDDDIPDPGEVFLVNLSNPGGGATLGFFTVEQVVLFDLEIFLDGFESGDTSVWSETSAP